uniref:Hydroxyproline-rich systemin n=1 Tax=Zeugodacus cucurbitae TaxID=28588 RepID=A0A0A1XEU0_ZEUCU
MFSKIQLFRISLVVSVISVIYEIPKTTAKLNRGVFSGATPGILPYGVLQQIQMQKNAHIPRRSALKSMQDMDKMGKSVMFPPTPYQDPMFGQTRRTSINYRPHNFITVKRKPSTARKQPISGLSRHNIELFHLYDDDGEHMLDLKVDKTEHRSPSHEPRRLLNASNRRKSVLYPKESSEGFKRIHHYWLYI